nr:MAG TPA: hypothetical protein [Caudoviricetes sp.]
MKALYRNLTHMLGWLNGLGRQLLTVEVGLFSMFYDAGSNPAPSTINI